jgi:hypothetical protein
MRKTSARLLDLPALSVRLNAVANKLEREEKSAEVRRLVSQTSDLMTPREEYYYLFSHGGCATGFNFSSTDLLNSCSKVRALISQRQQDVLDENKKDLVSKIREIVKGIEIDLRFAHSNLGMTYANIPAPRDAPTYFFSYSHKDKVSKQIAQRTFSKLGTTMKVWIDEKDLKRHQQLPSEISRAIQESTASLLILSKNFLESKWCNHEWQSVFMKKVNEIDYHLYVIRIDDSDFPALLSPFVFTDCRNFPRPEAVVELGKLLKEIEMYEMYRQVRNAQSKVQRRSRLAE